jgi:L-fuculose-phosphate aldolase
MCGKGFAIGTAGNISARVGDFEQFLITPSAYPYDKLTPEDLILADFNGEILAGSLKPSIEFSMHLGIYKKRPEVRAVVHTHSKYATAVSAMAGVEEIPAIDIETFSYIGGAVPIVPFAPPGSLELAKAVVDYIGDRGGVILESHGAIGVGTTMDAAMIVSDNIERTCEMFLAIKACGGEVKSLPDDYIASITEISRKHRGIVG